MEWYVYYYDINKKKITKWNIFDHWRFKEEVEKLLTKNISKEEFTEKLKNELQYWYWSKSEWEIILTPWIGDNTVEEKIDVYEQVMLNWDKFVDYVWSFKEKTDE